ncbi:MAG: ABC transporter permease subunit [Planctomycetota bacterium]
MLSGSLALFDRALKMEAIAMRGHLLRLGFAGFIEIALLIAAATALSKGAPGLSFFENICWLNVLFISLAAVSLFATAVTEEKEEGTLGLLRMANVGRAALMLGKSTSRLVAALLLLGVQMPFVLLAITLGGVLIGQITAAFVCLAAYLILVANLGLLWSVLSRRSATAAFWTGASLIGYFALPPIVGFLGNLLVQVAGTEPWAVAIKENGADRAAEFGVPHRLGEIFTTGFADGVWAPQVGFCLVAALFCFALAWICFERFADADRAAAPDRGLAGRSSSKDATTRSRPGRRPVAWKEWRFLVGGGRGLFLRFVGLFAVIGIIVGLLAYDGEDLSQTRIWGNIAGLWALVCVAAMAADSLFLATRILNEELKWNTLGNLLLLPKSTSSLVFGKIEGAVFALIPALVCGLIGLGAYVALANPSEVEDGLRAVVSPISWAFVAGWLLYITIVAYLSTVVRYGATVLAVIVYVVGGYALSPVFLVAFAVGGVTDSGEVAAVPIAGVLLALTVGGVALCIRRFESLGER